MIQLMRTKRTTETAPAPPARVLPPERVLLNESLALCRELGLWTWHDHDSRRNEPGLTDQLIVGTRTVWIEWKTETGQLSAAQVAAHNRLLIAGDLVFIGTPSSKHELFAYLRTIVPTWAAPSTPRPAGDHGEASKLAVAAMKSWSDSLQARVPALVLADPRFGRLFAQHHRDHQEMAAANIALADYRADKDC